MKNLWWPGPAFESLATPVGENAVGEAEPPVTTGLVVGAIGIPFPLDVEVVAPFEGEVEFDETVDELRPPGVY